MGRAVSTAQHVSSASSNSGAQRANSVEKLVAKYLGVDAEVYVSGNVAEVTLRYGDKVARVYAPYIRSHEDITVAYVARSLCCPLNPEKSLETLSYLEEAEKHRRAELWIAEAEYGYFRSPGGWMTRLLGDAGYIYTMRLRLVLETKGVESLERLLNDLVSSAGSAQVLSYIKALSTTLGLLPVALRGKDVGAILDAPVPVPASLRPVAVLVPGSKGEGIVYTLDGAQAAVVDDVADVLSGLVFRGYYRKSLATLAEATAYAYILGLWRSVKKGDPLQYPELAALFLPAIWAGDGSAPGVRPAREVLEIREKLRERMKDRRYAEAVLAEALPLRLILLDGDAVERIRSIAGEEDPVEALRGYRDLVEALLPNGSDDADTALPRLEAKASEALRLLGPVAGSLYWLIAVAVNDLLSAEMFLKYAFNILATNWKSDHDTVTLEASRIEEHIEEIEEAEMIRDQLEYINALLDGKRSGASGPENTLKKIVVSRPGNEYMIKLVTTRGELINKYAKIDSGLFLSEDRPLDHLYKPLHEEVPILEPAFTRFIMRVMAPAALLSGVPLNTIDSVSSRMLGGGGPVAVWADGVGAEVWGAGSKDNSVVMKWNGSVFTHTTIDNYKQLVRRLVKDTGDEELYMLPLNGLPVVLRPSHLFIQADSGSGSGSVAVINCKMYCSGEENNPSFRLLVDHARSMERESSIISVLVNGGRGSGIALKLGVPRGRVAELMEKIRGSLARAGALIVMVPPPASSMLYWSGERGLEIQKDILYTVGSITSPIRDYIDDITDSYKLGYDAMSLVHGALANPLVLAKLGKIACRGNGPEADKARYILSYISRLAVDLLEAIAEARGHLSRSGNRSGNKRWELLTLVWEDYTII